MSDALCFLKPFWQNAGQATHGLDQILVVAHKTAYKVLRVICLPTPFCANRIFVVPPAEDTLVRACKGRRGLHALVRGNPVESVLVAATAASKHAFRPSAMKIKR